MKIDVLNAGRTSRSVGLVQATILLERGFMKNHVFSGNFSLRKISCASFIEIIGAQLYTDIALPDAKFQGSTRWSSFSPNISMCELADDVVWCSGF